MKPVSWQLEDDVDVQGFIDFNQLFSRNILFAKVFASLKRLTLKKRERKSGSNQHFSGDGSGLWQLDAVG